MAMHPQVLGLTLDPKLTYITHIHISIQAHQPLQLIEDQQLPLVQCPKILGAHLDTSLSFNKHGNHVAERVSGRNNILKALTGTSWE